MWCKWHVITAEGVRIWENVRRMMKFMELSPGNASEDWNLARVEGNGDTVYTIVETVAFTLVTPTPHTLPKSLYPVGYSDM